MNTPYRRFRDWRAERRRKNKASCSDCADCGDCGDCSPFLLAPMLLFRVLPGALLSSAVDPYVERPASPGGRAAARLIRSYQLHVSVPRGRSVCTMTPTCSRYGLQAVSAHGLARGGLLVVRRLRRCGSGAPASDPVPRPQP